MSKLSQVLDEIRAKIAQYRGKKPCEEETKAKLINPVLGALGWDVRQDEVSMEFRHAPSHNPVDYGLLISGNPTVLVEAKALGESLAGGRWADKIMGYAGTSGATWVVLTNGDEYRIYNASVLVPFEQKLFRTVRLTDPNSLADTTLLLLSKERIDDLHIQWQIHFADSQIQAAVVKLFSPPPDSRLVGLVRKHVKGLTLKEIRASLARVCTQLSFHTESTSPPGKPNGNGSHRKPPKDEYNEFWAPIRREGLFKGEPANGPWIPKQIRGICLSLVVHNHACCVDVGFHKEDKAKRRDNAAKLFLTAALTAKYRQELHESKKYAYIRFFVLDKGIKDRGHWPQIREELTTLGADIHKRIKDSDV